MSAKGKSKNLLPRFAVLAGTCLGHKVYRGFGPLDALAELSKPDIFDQETNKVGTQRNLNLPHARRAYEYSDKSDAFYPEMILNVRDASFVKFSAVSEEADSTFGMLEFIKDPEKSDKIVVSRLDGNHRLWFADGHEKGMKPLSRPVSFCFLTIEDQKKELELFRDINDNQMGMSTSHLQNITARLLGDKALKVQDPALYIVERLMRDQDSPLRGRVYEGGKARKERLLTGLTVANLKSAIKDMIGRSAKLSQLPDSEAQYVVIKNYWSALREWLPKAWKNPRDYIMFKGVGLYAISYLGIEVIDRCLLKGRFASQDMLKYLKQIPAESLANKGALPYAGRGGGRKLANDLIANLEEEGQVSVAKLQKLILNQG